MSITELFLFVERVVEVPTQTSVQISDIRLRLQMDPDSQPLPGRRSRPTLSTLCRGTYRFQGTTPISSYLQVNLSRQKF